MMYEDPGRPLKRRDGETGRVSVAIDVLTVAVELENPQPLVLVRDVNIASRIDEHVLGLLDEAPHRLRTVAVDRIRGDEPGDLSWQRGVRDVVYAETGIEVRQVHQRVGMIRERAVVMLVDVVRPESPALLAEVLVRQAAR